MIKTGETFYAVEQKSERAVDFEGNSTAGKVHGPFVCIGQTTAVVKSKNRNFNIQDWAFRKANKKLLAQSCTKHGDQKSADS